MSDRCELPISPETKVEEFLTYLAVQRKVAVSTQNQAMKITSAVLESGRGFTQSKTSLLLINL